MRTGIAVALALGIFLQTAPAQRQNQPGSGDHWVATWATAQELKAGGRATGPPANIPATFADQTVRMVVRVSLGGRRVRIELSNMAGAQLLEIGSAHVGLHKGGGAIVDGTDRVLTFSGRSAFAIPAGAIAVSDPVDLDVAPLAELAV